jgi:hypothetical protein
MWSRQSDPLQPGSPRYRMTHGSLNSTEDRKAPGTIKAPARGLPPWPGPSCEERVTRIELALSAWEAERLRLPGALTSQVS